MAGIFPVSKKDYEHLARFLSRESTNKNKEFWLERFGHWWKNNPSFSADTKRGWILKEGREIVGFLGNIPTKLMLFGKEVNAFNGTNWVVTPKFRNESMKLFFNQLHGSEIVFITSPSDMPVILLKKLNLPLIARPDGTENRKSVILLDFSGLLKLKLSDRFRGGSVLKSIVSFFEKASEEKYIGRSLTMVLNGLFKLYQPMHLEKSDSKNVKVIKKADGSFAELWGKTKDIYATTNIRSPEIINWYLGNKNHKIIMFGRYDDKELLGYIIFKIYNKDRIWECIDLWTNGSKKNVAESLIGFSQEYATKRKSALLVFPHFSRKIKELYRKLGLVTLNFGERREYLKLNTGKIEDLKDSNSYFVSLQGDHDIW